MKFAIAALVLAQVSSGLAFSQTATKASDWSIYPSSAKHGVTLIQVTSKEQYASNRGEQVSANLDAVCTNGKLAAIAVDTNSIVPEKSLIKSGSVDMLQVSYEAGNQATGAESWAVLDHGRTLSPYAEVLQGRRTHEWGDRLLGVDTLVLHFAGADGASTTATFSTKGFAQALATAGCR
jgi:hypothetical protein